MNRILLSTLCLLLFFFSTTSCKQDKDTPDQKQFLYKTWLMSSNMVQRNDGPKEDVYAQMEDCQKDDELIFFENGTYEMNSGKDECQLSILEQGTWELYDRQLFINQQEYTVLELSSSTLIIRQTSNKANEKIVVTTTFKVK